MRCWEEWPKHKSWFEPKGSRIKFSFTNVKNFTKNFTKWLVGTLTKRTATRQKEQVSTMEFTEKAEKRRRTRISETLSMIIVNSYLFTKIPVLQIADEFKIDRKSIYNHLRKWGFEPIRNPNSGNRVNHVHNRRKEEKR